MPVTPLLAHLWHKNQLLMLDRLALLDHAAAAPEDRALREEAIGTAHKLAGSLGMFGFPKGTEIARGIEQGLEAGSLSPDDFQALAAALRSMLFPDPTIG